MSVELSLRRVRAGYGPVEALHGIDVDVPAGTVTALLGPNGAGKSTLLSAVAGLLPVRSGEILWGGRQVQDQAAHQRAAAGMLLVPERRGIFPGLTVRENLEIYAGRRTGWDAAVAAFPVLRERLGQRAGSLSGGEQRMLAMSHPLLRPPRLLLLDEISFGLAPRVRRQLLGVVADIAGCGATVLLVEQRPADGVRLAAVVYVLSHGEVSFAGDASEYAD